jgi:homogentisate 1,2-dioxygenase
MAYYQTRGSIPPKRHTQHRVADGRLYFEELMGEEGFFADSSFLYHREIPSALVDVRGWVFDGLAVMVDTFLPLRLGEGGQTSDDGRYAWSWSGRGPA